MKIAAYTLLTIAFIGVSYFAWAYKKLDKRQKEEVEFENFVAQNNADSSIQVLLAQYPTNTQIAVAIIDGDKTNYHCFIKKETAVESVDSKQKFFEIGSITKTFTAALAAHCFQKGLLKSTTTLKDVLSFSMPEEVANITLQQLSNHTSGLPRLPKNMKMEDPTNPYNEYDTAQLFTYLEKAKLESVAGTKYSYSNLGMALLGVICAKKLNMSYQNALQQYVFAPLKMNQSSIVITNEQQKNLVRGLNTEGEETSNWDWDCMAGAGAIKSNLDEMALYAKANLDSTNTLFSLCHQPTFKNNDMMSMAMAWHIITSRSGNKILFHNGGTGGYTSSMMLLPNKNKGVIILSNVSAFHHKMSLLDALCGQLLEK